MFSRASPPAKRVNWSLDVTEWKRTCRWTPTVSHYAHDFETDWDQAKTRLVRRDFPSTALKIATGATKVVMEVDDPSGDRDACVVLVVWLVRDSGFWRVTHLGFETGKRSIDGKIPPPLVQTVSTQES